MTTFPALTHVASQRGSVPPGGRRKVVEFSRLVVEGHLRVTADGQDVDLVPGGLLHMQARLPHAVVALEPSKLALIMVDAAR